MSNKLTYNGKEYRWKDGQESEDKLMSASGFIGDYNGGVAFVNTGAKLVARNCTFSGNAGRNGGVIYMADGVIEEEGTPEEVFGDPKSEKTKAFIAHAFDRGAEL